MVEYSGVIRNVYTDNRMFDMIYKNQVIYFYLTKSLMKKFEPYLITGYVCNVCCYDEKRNIDNISCSQVQSFNKIFKIIGNREEVFFDKDEVRRSFIKLLNKDKNRLFIDLEFSMPPYNHNHSDNNFYSEIIWYGMILESSDGKVIDTSESFIKPKCKIGLNERTYSFINVSEKEFNKKSEYYSKFYNTLRDYMMLYQPVIYIWGKNDYLVIKDSFEKNKVKPLCDRSMFVNLMQLFKTYFNLHDDPGLYKAFELFNKKAPMEVQDHNPLHDALALEELFHLFLNELEKNN